DAAPPVISILSLHPRASALIAPAVQVAAQDAAGNTVPTFTGSVTLALGGTNPAGGVLAGTTTVAAVNGAASFATLSVDKSGDYWLAAPATAPSGGASTDNSVSTAAERNGVVKGKSGDIGAGHNIKTEEKDAVQVAAQDAAGSTVPSFWGSVTVALGGTNPAGGTLAGTTTVAAVNGVASFATLSIDKSGSYWLTATAPATGLSGGTSNDFSIA